LSHSQLVQAAKRFGLPDGTVAALEALVALIADDPHAPTGASGPEQVAAQAIDSLQGLAVAELRAAERVVDLGSGAGFPGLVLALALPEAVVALVEANGRKADFLRKAARALGASRARVVAGRAEEWREGLGWADAVVAKALGPQPVVLEYAAPLLRLGGVVVDWRSQRSGEEVRRGRAAAQLLGLVPLRDHRYAPRRQLEVFRKERPTPERFPRRPGVAVKRPLA